MASRIEDYAVIGDTRTVALVDRGGSIDWWCAPRLDSAACFAALLGTPDNGRWLVAPAGEVTATRRSYRDGSLVLETEHETPTGTVSVIDFMPVTSEESEQPSIFRVVRGRSGTVDMTMELVVRFDYGSIVPWVTDTGDGLTLVAGHDGLQLHSPVPVEGRGMTSAASFTVREGQDLSFCLTWYPSRLEPPVPRDSLASLRRTEDWWHDWVGRCTYQGEWRDEVVRSLITLKALSYAPTGAVAAAATTSLPEWIGGVRNWDYRYSWLRDASFTLQCLLQCGYTEEAVDWHRWLRRAVAGSPGDFQIMYGIRGERRLTEIELDWLEGYEGSKPVRIGNGASDQFQLDVFGEVLDAWWTAARSGLRPATVPNSHGGFRDMALSILEHLDQVWREPDDGIWEIRGPRRHFTHSKVMAWVAYDRAVRAAEAFGSPDLPVADWRATRDEIHAQVCEQGWNDRLGSFVQSYGSDQLDASLLVLARVGFLPGTDPRIVGTVEAVQRELVVDGFVRRYATDDDGEVDGLPPGEGAFLLTTFWLADNLALIGRRDEAVAVFERLRTLKNDVGLFSEEYDPAAGRMLGNFPQAFSHLAFIVTAASLSLGDEGPVAQRAGGAAAGPDGAAGAAGG